MNPLRKNKYEATKNKKPSASGNKTFHPKNINWSYRFLGKEARTQTKTKSTAAVLEPKMMPCSKVGTLLHLVR